MPVPRHALVALLLACCAVVAVGASPAVAACPATETSLDQQTMRADAVFTGTVDGRRSEGRQVVYSVAVDRVYKGDVDPEVAVTGPARRAQCGLGPIRGDAYVFFATADGADLTTDSRSGTAPATDSRVNRVERLLGEGSPAIEPEPIEATLTTVADEPTSLERVAAPGVALIIVGLLGLVLVAALGRRRA